MCRHTYNYVMLGLQNNRDFNVFSGKMFLTLHVYSFYCIAKMKLLESEI